MIELLISITVFMVIHTSSMALFMPIFGVKVMEVSYGIGPTLLSVGKFKFQPIPIGGYVRALDSREEELTDEDLSGALNHQPVATQVFLPLSGCILIILISFLILGESAITSLISGFQDVIFGALRPLTEGQEIIQRSRDFIQSSTLITVIAVVQLKFVALNLMPLSTLNGGQAIVNLLKMGKPAVDWENIVFKISLLVALVIALSWGSALLYYVW